MLKGQRIFDFHSIINYNIINLSYFYLKVGDTGDQTIDTVF